MAEKKLDKKIIILDLIISIAIIVLLLKFIGVKDFLSEVWNINLYYLFLGIFFLLLMYIGMIWRIKIMLDEQKVKYNLFDVVKAHWVGMLWADFTPARMGYFSSVAVLHKKNIPSEKAMLAVFGPQMFDFILKFIVGTISIFYIVTYVLKVDKIEYFFLGSLVIGAMVLAMLLLLFSKRFLLLFAFSKKFPFFGTIYEMFERMQENSHAVIKKTPHILALMLYTWTMKAISWMFIAKSVGIVLNLPFPELLFFMFFQPTITMLEFVPSPTLAGLGLSEGASLIVLGLFGVPPPKATAFALIARFKTTLVNLPAIPESIKMINSYLK